MTPKLKGGVYRAPGSALRKEVLDITNETMFPSIALAEKIDKDEKTRIKQRKEDLPVPIIPQQSPTETPIAPKETEDESKRPWLKKTTTSSQQPSPVETVKATAADTVSSWRNMGTDGRTAWQRPAAAAETPHQRSLPIPSKNDDDSDNWRSSKPSIFA